MIILAILAAIAVPRFIDLDINARQRAIDAAIFELNGRESLTWANRKISGTNYNAGNIDTVIFGFMTSDNKSLGADYAWGGTWAIGGGTLSFKGDAAAPLTRQAATVTSPARWSKQ